MDYPKKHKCVYTVAIDNWQPELCAITIPNLKRYAQRIGADFKVISQAKFDGYPPNYERLQVHELGKEYLWNIVFDADIILHKDFEDPTTLMDKSSVGSLWMMDAKYYFTWNKYFERDGRNIGIADYFVVSSWYTHDIWTPLDMDYETAQKFCLREPRQVSEYCLSLNVSKFGLKFNPLIKDHSKLYTIMTTTKKIDNPRELMISKLVEWKDYEFLESVGVKK